jgi:hypothetical protein
VRRDRRKGGTSVAEKAGKASRGERNGSKERTSIAEKAECERRTTCFRRASARARVESLYSRKARFHQKTNKTAIMGGAGAKTRPCINLGIDQRQGEEEGEGREKSISGSEVEEPK